VEGEKREKDGNRRKGCGLESFEYGTEYGRFFWSPEPRGTTGEKTFPKRRGTP